MLNFYETREGHEIIRRVLNCVEIAAISMIYSTAAVRAASCSGNGYTLSNLCEERLADLILRAKADGNNRF